MPARKKANQAVPAAPKMVTVTVARGTLSTGDGDYGRGEQVDVPETDLERLYDMGIVIRPGTPDPGEVQDGQLKLSMSEGATTSQVAP